MNPYSPQAENVPSDGKNSKSVRTAVWILSVTLSFGIASVVLFQDNFANRLQNVTGRSMAFATGGFIGLAFSIACVRWKKRTVLFRTSGKAERDQEPKT